MRIIIGRELFSSLGLAVVQNQAKRDIAVSNIDYTTDSKFYQNVTANHQKVVAFRLIYDIELLLNLAGYKKRMYRKAI